MCSFCFRNQAYFTRDIEKRNKAVDRSIHPVTLCHKGKSSTEMEIRHTQPQYRKEVNKILPIVCSKTHIQISIRVRPPNNTRITKPVSASLMAAVETLTVRYVTASTAFPGSDRYIIVSHERDRAVGTERAKGKGQTDASVGGCHVDILFLGARGLCRV